MEKTITEIVLDSGAPGTFDKNGGDFDILREAVITADLAGALNDESATLTVFAPTDTGFKDLAAALGYGGQSEKGALNWIVESLTLLGRGDALPLLTEVLTYHVAPTELFAADVLGSTGITTLQGGTLVPDGSTTPPSLTDADDGLPNPGIIATDIDASNGVIHALNGVLLPVSVTGILSEKNTDFVVGDKGSAFYHTGKGDDYISARGGLDLVKAGRGDDVALGGSGRDVLFGDGGKDALFGQNGFDVLYGGRGADVLDGGAGHDRLIGGRGDDTFVFSTGYKRDVIVDFDYGNDVVDLSGSGLANFSEVQDALIERDFATILDLGDGDRLVFFGRDADDLHAGDFLFA